MSNNYDEIYAELLRQVDRKGLEHGKTYVAGVFEAVYRASVWEQDPEKRERAKELACDFFVSCLRVDNGLKFVYGEVDSEVWNEELKNIIDGMDDTGSDDPAGR